MPGKEYLDRVLTRRRILMLLSIVFILFIALIGRLTYIMTYKSKDYIQKAKMQWTSDVKIDARRGRILDRNFNELAVSANVYRVDLDMNPIRQTVSSGKETFGTISQKLGTALNIKAADVNAKLNKKLPNGLPIGSINLARRVEKNEADKVSDLDIKGVMVSPDTKRYYPQGNFLSQVLGHTNSDGKGLTGIELVYNKELSGTPGMRLAEITKNSSNYSESISEFSEPQNGKDVVLTIDEMIQYFCEKAAQEALINNKAKAVTVMVMNPKNGEILGMANKPDYDPNNPWVQGKSYDELNKSWRNRAVSDTFEPGSIFKVVTATAAMEEGVIKDNDVFNCSGSLKVGGRTIKCWKHGGHGSQSFVEILKNSCNVGFMQVGARLGSARLLKYINLFGFGKKTGIDLNGEAKGIIKRKNINDVDLATMSFGQVNTLSCIQYMQAFNTVANGGYLITPHLEKETGNYSDDKFAVDSTYSNYNKRRILDESTMKTLRGYLEQVISEGGGHKAYIDGFHIAGKTGTGQKPVNGAYQHGKYVSSFAGMAPASDPKITVFVSIDEPDPSNYYAGQIATPVAKEVFYDVFNYLGIKPDTSTDNEIESMKKDVTVPELRGMSKSDAVKLLKEKNLTYSIDDNGDYIVKMSPYPGYTVKEGSKIILYTGSSDAYNKEVVVPDLNAYNEDEAKKVLESLGLKYEFSGSGLVSDQSPEPGEKVQKGTKIKIYLEDLED